MLEAYIAKAIDVADDISQSAGVSRKEFWENNPYLEGAPGSAAKKARLASLTSELDPKADPKPEPEAKKSQKERKAFNVQLRAAGIDPQVYNRAKQAASSQAKGGKPPKGKPKSGNPKPNPTKGAEQGKKGLTRCC